LGLVDAADFVRAANPDLRPEGWVPPTPPAPKPVFKQPSTQLRESIARLARSRKAANLLLASRMLDTVIEREKKAGRDTYQESIQFIRLRVRAYRIVLKQSGPTAATYFLL
jgi:hypothetical protein